MMTTLRSVKVLLSLNLILAVAAALVVTSCKNKCRGIDCGANGDCDRMTGICTCDTGYEGSYCETTWSEKFVSASGWGASDNVTASTSGTPLGRFTYVPIITPAGNTALTVSPMSGFSDSTVTLNLTTPMTFTLSSTDSAGRVYTGSGTSTADGSTITIQYTVTYTDSNADTATGTWTKN